MLSLDSPRWKKLRACHGAADEIPDLLRDLADAPGDSDAWDAIYTALCHQDSVYQATYAAVPHIVELGAGLAPEEAAMCWSFVGHVAASLDAEPVPAELAADYQAALRRCEPLIRATIAAAPAMKTSPVYLLAAVAAVRGHVRIACLLEDVSSDPDLRPICPGCDLELMVGFDGERLNASSEEFDVEEITAIEPPEPPTAWLDPAATLWDPARITGYLLTLADQAGDPDLVTQLSAWEGTVTCPSCAHRFALRPRLVEQPTEI